MRPPKTKVTTDLKPLKEAHRHFLLLMSLTMQEAVDEATEVVFQEMRRLTNLTDHSLEQLRQEGHPYRAAAPQGNPHEDYLVHFQSGDLRRGLRRTKVRGKSIITAEIRSNSPYTWHLLLGTRYMRPRDFVSAAVINKTREVGRIFDKAHRRVHKEAEERFYKPFRILLPHTRFPAQLPDEGD